MEKIEKTKEKRLRKEEGGKSSFFYSPQYQWLCNEISRCQPIANSAHNGSYSSSVCFSFSFAPLILWDNPCFVLGTMCVLLSAVHWKMETTSVRFGWSCNQKCRLTSTALATIYTRASPWVFSFTLKLKDGCASLKHWHTLWYKGRQGPCVIFRALRNSWK